MPADAGLEFQFQRAVLSGRRGDLHLSGRPELVDLQRSAPVFPDYLRIFAAHGARPCRRRRLGWSNSKAARDVRSYLEWLGASRGKPPRRELVPASDRARASDGAILLVYGFPAGSACAGGQRPGFLAEDAADRRFPENAVPATC